MNPVAHTRLVTVTNLICGVDISLHWLDARIGHEGAFAQFPNTAEGIAALLDQYPIWRELDQTFRAIKGRAARTVARRVGDAGDRRVLQRDSMALPAGSW